MKAAVLLQLMLVSALFAAPPDAVQAALEDARRLGQGAAHVRYLDLSAVPEKDRDTWSRVLDFQVNSLSREATLEPLGRVSPEVLRIQPILYGAIFAKAYERLAEVEPYYHLVTEQEQEYGYYLDAARTRWVKTRVEKRKVRALLPIPSDKAMSELATLTQSQAPIARADWFLRLTAIQQVGAGHSYYEFLGLKNRADYEELIGLDRKKAEDRYRELRAIVQLSGVVTKDQRQILYLGTLAGGHWRTLDSVKTQGNKNALKNLDADYKHDAEEGYGFLPNNLFALYISDAQGKLANAAPGDVANNHSKPLRNDTQVHIPFGCVTCHREGLRPIDDWARDFYTPPVGLASTDFEKYQRLKRLYLRPFEAQLKRDIDQYAAAVKHLTGWTPAELAEAYDSCVRWYHLELVDVAQASRELGCTPEWVKAVIELRLKDPYAGPFQSVLPALIKGRKLLRDHWEEEYAEMYSLLQKYPEKR